MQLFDARRAVHHARRCRPAACLPATIIPKAYKIQKNPMCNSLPLWTMVAIFLVGPPSGQYSKNWWDPPVTLTQSWCIVYLIELLKMQGMLCESSVTCIYFFTRKANILRTYHITELCQQAVWLCHTGCMILVGM